MDRVGITMLALGLAGLVALVPTCTSRPVRPQVPSVCRPSSFGRGLALAPDREVAIAAERMEGPERELDAAWRIVARRSAPPFETVALAQRGDANQGELALAVELNGQWWTRRLGGTSWGCAIGSDGSWPIWTTTDPGTLEVTGPAVIATAMETTTARGQRDARELLFVCGVGAIGPGCFPLDVRAGLVTVDCDGTFVQAGQRVHLVIP
jgi:hypothetical protein